MKNILLMTATVSPNAGRAITLRADPEVRRKDYEDALRFYLSIGGTALDGIIFCENSGADLGSLEAIARAENPLRLPVTFHSSVSDSPVEYGKSHAELLMMDRVYADLISGQPETIRYWKVTGRIRIAKLDRVIRTTPPDTKLIIDLRLVPSWLRRFGTDRWADTRLIGFTPMGYEAYLLEKRRLVGTPGHSYTVELAIFPLLLEAFKRGEKVVPRFGAQPVMMGIGAESNKDYNSVQARLKNTIRRFTRRLLPSLWL